MRKRFESLIAALAIPVLIAGAMSFAACGDDDGPDPDSGAADAATTSDAADTSDAAASAAVLFCNRYELTCTYGTTGTKYTDVNDCVTSFNGYAASRQACVTQHLGFAEGGDTVTHCPHAEGGAPCN